MSLVSRLRSLDPRVTIAVVFVAGQFMSIMDTTIVNVALPALSKHFAVATGSIDAIVVGYLISLAVFIPASGWLGDRFGTKRVFLCALGTFTFSSALCGLSQSFEQLVVFRVLQGIGAGMLTPVGMAMLFRAFPPEQRVQASRILVIPTAVAPAFGPVIGGFLVDKVSWRWVFYVNVPIGIAALLFGLACLQEHRETAAGSFDVPGFLLACTGFPLLMFTLTEGATRGWSSPLILSTGLLSVLLLLAFAWLELRLAAPLLQVRLLANRLFAVTSSTVLVTSAGFLGLLFLVPLFVQEGRGSAALTSGLITFPEPFGVVTAAQIATRLYLRIGPRRIMLFGLLFMACVMVALSFVRFDTNTWVIRVLMYFAGCSLGCVFIPAQAAAFTQIVASDMGRASTIFNAGRQLGAALGVSVLATVLSVAGQTRTDVAGVAHPYLTAYRLAFGTSALFALASAVIVYFLRDRDAAATMQRAVRVQEEGLEQGAVTVAFE